MRNQRIRTDTFERDLLCQIRTLAVRRSCLSKGVAPSGKHVGRVVVPVSRITLEGLLKKGKQRIANRRVQKVGIDSDLRVDQVRRTLAVTPTRRRPRRHFIENYGNRIPFGSCVPTAPARELQKWLKVWRRPRANLIERGICERKVEYLETLLKKFSIFLNADIVGLQVAMRYAHFLQVLNHLEQVFAVALKKLQRQPANIFQFLRQSSLARIFHEKPGLPIRERQQFPSFHYQRVGKFLECAMFSFNTLIIFGATSDFQHQPLSIALHQ